MSSQLSLCSRAKCSNTADMELPSHSSRLGWCWNSYSQYCFPEEQGGWHQEAGPTQGWRAQRLLQLGTPGTGGGHTLRHVPRIAQKEPETTPLSAHSSPTLLSTLKEVDPFPATVAMGRKSQGCFHVVWDATEAFRDVSGVIRVQNTILKAPVLTTLRGKKGEME